MGRGAAPAGLDSQSGSRGASARPVRRHYDRLWLSTTLSRVGPYPRRTERRGARQRSGDEPEAHRSSGGERDAEATSTAAGARLSAPTDYWTGAHRAPATPSCPKRRGGPKETVEGRRPDRERYEGPTGIAKQEARTAEGRTGTKEKTTPRSGNRSRERGSLCFFRSSPRRRGPRSDSRRGRNRAAAPPYFGATSHTIWALAETARSPGITGTGADFAMS